MRKIFLTLFAASIATSPLNAKCEVGKLLEFKVTMQGLQPQADILINGRTVPFIVDSGAFFSAISPGTAAELGLRLEASTLQMEGVGGRVGNTSIAHVKAVNLAGIDLHNIEFVVGGSEFGVGGLLGQNVLGIGDVEYDLGQGTIRLMRSLSCSSNDNLAYWSGQQPVSELVIDKRDAIHPHTIGMVSVNGVKLRALFDTGSPFSILSLGAAKRVGLTPATPGVERAGETGGVGRSRIETWRVPIDNIAIGTEQVRNLKLLIGDVGFSEADMLIGADFFLSHRVYVANSLRKIYFTYDGGPIFNATPGRIIDQAGKAETIAADRAPDPTDASGFSRRGAAELSRRDYKAALADLDRAVAMEPRNGQFLLQRARVQFVMDNRSAALADLDRAAEVAPNDPQIRMVRAESLLSRKRNADALGDLEAVNAALAPQSDDRLALAGSFEMVDQFDKAIANYDRWITAHPDDSRLPEALNGRCWARALAGRELPLALKDCDAAIRRIKSGAFFDSRGLVELRMGQYEQAITDYDAALRLAPRTAWSLYGRGLARRHKNDPSAQNDLNAAIAIDPGLPSRLKSLGIS